jgi:hypothetical protein
VFYLNDVIDLHVHSGPDVLGRVADDVDMALQCRDAGMAGIAVKAHLESTSSRAYHVNRQVSDFRYIGGICLNYPVGGINPSAVDASLNLGGRVVWMPSGHSRFHAEVKGTLGSWGPADQTMGVPRGAEGLSILDENGDLTQDALDVVELVKQHNALLCTSHLSPLEIATLSAHCGEQSVKLVFTHVLWTPAYSLELAETVVANGGYVELTAGVVAGYNRQTDADGAVQIIRRLGADHMIIASDSGGLRATAPAESLRALAENLLHRGTTEQELRTLLVDNPAMLVAA